jgi:hypothetical protein
MLFGPLTFRPPPAPKPNHGWLDTHRHADSIRPSDIRHPQASGEVWL